jgi:hypothetical protein
MFKISFKVILTGITLPGIYETSDCNICCKYLGVTHSNKCTKKIYVVFADGVSRKRERARARAPIHIPCNNMFLVLI